jgi:hypothetical protein
MDLPETTGTLSRPGYRTALVGCLLSVVCATGCPWGSIGIGKGLPLEQAVVVDGSVPHSETSAPPLGNKNVEGVRPVENTESTTTEADDTVLASADEPAAEEQLEQVLVRM